MAKYEPLRVFLRRQRRAEGELTFRDIERIVGGILPKAAADEAWWRPDPCLAAQPQQRVFAEAGFTVLPSIRAETVRFIRLESDTV